MTARLILSALVFAGALLAWPRALRADESERAGLLEAARIARSAGEHAEALEAALRAAAIRPTSPLLRFIAEEQLELGNASAAQRAAEECLTLAASEPQSANRDAVVTGCEFMLRDRRERVAPDTPDRAHRGEDTPPPRERPPAPPPKALAAPGALTSAPEPAPQRPLRWVGPVVLLGTGATSLVVAGISRWVADTRFEELKSRCERAACPADAAKQRDGIETLDTVAVATAITGVVLAGAGVGWLVVSAGSSSDGSGHAVHFGIRATEF